MKKHFLYSLLITGFLGGLLLTWQLNASVPLEGNFPSDEVEARADLLKSFLDEQSYLQSRIVTLRKKLEENQQKIDVQSEKFTVDFLENLKMDVGLVEAIGEGLEIVLDDGSLADRSLIEASSVNLIQASQIRDIVNILNAADADAISINNQRIIASSSIASVGTTILINNSHIAPPFVISTIGDTEIMLQRLLNKSLLPDLYEKNFHANILFEIYKKNRLNVPIYNADLKMEYLYLVENNEL